MEAFRQAIERSKIPRFKWKKVVGCTLTTWLYNMFDNHNGKIETTRILIERLRNFYRNDYDTQQQFTLKKLIQSANISVSARFNAWSRLRR